MIHRNKAYRDMILEIHLLDAQNISIVELAEDDPRLLHIQKLARKSGDDGSLKKPKREYDHRPRKDLTSLDYKMAEDVVRGITMAEMRRKYKCSSGKIYRICKRLRIANRPRFSYMLKLDKKIIYFVSTTQIRDFLSQKLNINLAKGISTLEIKKRIAKHNIKMEAGSWHWYNLNDGESYAPLNETRILTKNGIESYGIKTAEDKHE